MRPSFMLCFSVPLLALATCARADDAVVGNGTAASCTEPALDAAIFRVYFGDSQGGRVSFDCGAAPVTIPLTTTRILDGGVTTEIDGGGKITLDAGRQRRHVDVSGANTRVTLRGLVFVGGFAAPGTYGGAVYQRDASTLIVEDCRFSGNEGGLGGGALAGDDATVQTVRRSLFEDNLADSGGAISKSFGRFELVDSTFIGNRAVNLGGAVFWRETFGEIARSRFIDNEATEGGGLWIRGAFADVLATSFEGNHSVTLGGAVSVERTVGGSAPPVRLIGVTARDNSAGQGGGAFHIRGDSFASTVNSPTRLVNVSTAGNRVLASTGTGGDLLVQNASSAGFSNLVEIAYSTLIDARAPGGGVAVHVFRNSRVFVRKSVLWGASGIACATSGTNPVLASNGDNVIPTGGCPFAEPSDRTFATRAALVLAPIGDYGGDVDTHLPLPGSPLIDVAACENTLTAVDARGRPRQVDGDGDLVGGRDSGAVERQPSDVGTPATGLPFADGFEG